MVNSAAEGDELRRRPAAPHAPEVESCAAIVHDATAPTAHPMSASIFESLAPSATAETVRTEAVLRLQRTSQLRACGTRAASSSCGSPREASGGQPTHPEAQSVVAHVLDGLQATGSIYSQHPVAVGWSADLITAPSSTVEEPIQTSRHRRQTAERP